MITIALQVIYNDRNRSVQTTVVFRRLQKTRKDAADVTWRGSSFQTRAAATRNVRSTTTHGWTRDVPPPHWKSVELHATRLQHALVFNTIFKKIWSVNSVEIIEIVATRCQTIRLKCAKFNFPWGFAPDPAAGDYSTPQAPSLMAYC